MLRLSLLLTFFIVGFVHHTSDAEPKKTKRPTMNIELIEIINTSKDEWELNDAANALAKSKDPNEHVALSKALVNNGFLSLVDTEEDYESASIDLKLAGIIRNLAENNLPSTQQVLAKISQDKIFLSHPSRVDLLIDAWSLVKPSPPIAIKFWDSYSSPEDGFVERTVMRIAENGSEPAIFLLEKKLKDSRFEIDTRAYWIRRHSILLRDDAVMLIAVQRMLAGGIEEALISGLIEVLFDYQPKLWYRPHDIPKIPDRSNITEEAMRLLIGIGHNARTQQKLSEDLGQKVLTTIKLLEERLGD